MTSQINNMTAEEFDEYFDNGGDISELLTEHATRIVYDGRKYEQKVISATLPVWLVDVLDNEATRMGVSRKAVINMWLVERADREVAKRKTA